MKTTNITTNQLNEDLFKAICDYNFEDIPRLIESGADIEAIEAHTNLTPIMKVASLSDIPSNKRANINKMFNALVDLGADLSKNFNADTNHQMTLRQVAHSAKNQIVINCLINLNL